MTNKKEIRYTLDGENNSAEERLLKDYSGGKHSKKSLIADCLTAGYIMKEAGLADMIAVLDTDPSFRSATGLAKRERIIAMLAPSQNRAEPQNLVEPKTEATRDVEPLKKPKATLPTLGQ